MAHRLRMGLAVFGLTVLGLLSVGLFGPGYLYASPRGRIDAARHMLDSLARALAYYAEDTGGYPAELTALIERPAGIPGWRGPYVPADRLPRTDPWGYPLHYRRYIDGFVLQTLGADSRPGGQGPSADIRIKVGVSDRPMISQRAD